MACDQLASFCPSASHVIFQQWLGGRYYSRIDDSCIIRANDGSLLVSMASFRGCAATTSLLVVVVIPGRA
jgi:hypothetical protein